MADPDARRNQMRITITAYNGTVSLGKPGRVQILNNGTSQNVKNVTFFGSIEDLNAAMDGLRYTPDPDFFGIDDLDVYVNDQGHNGVAVEDALPDGR